MDSLFEQIAINSIRDKQSLQRRVPPPPIGPPPGAFSPGLGLPPPTPPPTPSRVAPAESEDTDDGFVTFSSSLVRQGGERASARLTRRAAAQPGAAGQLR